MKESEITDQQIIEESRQILSNPQLRRCEQCAWSDPDCLRCSKLNKPLARWMYSGLCKFYETDEERIIRKTRESLKRQEKEEEKVNHILTMALNCIEASMLFLEDFSDRVEKEYRAADYRGMGDPKVRRADRNWIANLKKANKAMHNNIEGARKQFQHYVMPIFNKVFFDKESGQYDFKMYDDHLSDSMELAHLVLRYFDVAYMSQKNADAIQKYIISMDSHGVLEEKDFIRYRKDLRRL